MPNAFDIRKDLRSFTKAGFDLARHSAPRSSREGFRPFWLRLDTVRCSG